MSSMDVSDEKDKIQFALELAIHEITKKSRGVEGEDNEDLDESKVVDKKSSKPAVTPKKYKGTSTLIKLPFVIGTKEFNDHKFAGLVYLGTGDE